jgi:hypothetical protein
MINDPREADVLDEAYDRLHRTGPEFDGFLSNHGPMAVEALVRHGHADTVTHWTDRYSARLEELPVPSDRITADTWRGALGDARRLGDWPAWFEAELAERPWTDVLATWWPRLLPGVAAGATHGVIRVGHAVRVLREAGETPERLAELSQALGYWAARWQPVPRTTAPAGVLGTADALAGIPRIPHQSGGIGDRLAQLETLADWDRAQGRAVPAGTADEVPDFLRSVVTAALLGYNTHALGSPVMLVHAATAPNAILRTLPSLPRELWPASAGAGWTAAAAIFAVYAPPGDGAIDQAGPVTTAPDAFEAAVANGDEHAIKLADTALDVYDWTADPRALSAAHLAATLLVD